MSGLRVLVINPSGEESLGLLEGPILEAGAKTDEYATKEAVAQLDSGEPLPQVRVVDRLPRRSTWYDCMIVLGSPRGVLTSPPEDAGDVQCPPSTIQQVENLVRDFHSHNKPVLGLCLGAQLIARSFGGAVKKMPRDAVHTALPGLAAPHGVEFGFHAQDFSEAARLDKVLGTALKEAEAVASAKQAGLAPKFCQWHSDCFEYPQDAVPLSTRSSCPTQAFRMGQRTYAFQYHIEVGRELGEEWYHEYSDGTATHASCGAGPATDDKARKTVDAHLQSCVKDGSIEQCEAFTTSLMSSMLKEAKVARVERQQRLCRRLALVGAVHAVAFVTLKLMKRSK